MAIKLFFFATETSALIEGPFFLQNNSYLWNITEFDKYRLIRLCELSFFKQFSPVCCTSALPLPCPRSCKDRSSLQPDPRRHQRCGWARPGRKCLNLLMSSCCSNLGTGSDAFYRSPVPELAIIVTETSAEISKCLRYIHILNLANSPSLAWILPPLMIFLPRVTPIEWVMRESLSAPV